ncbi:acyl carrier protein [Aureibaculum luteum]|uniref:acyl carrier protein n=1 Tax=Aureibaculum luteum TaxID=1548456 RepID=UPI000E4FC593|nr:acyl carrier protein [Aureibaculum luteum]
MDRNVIVEKLRDIFVRILEHEEFDIKDELSAADVNGWDSLSHMLIVGEVEDTFSIKFKFRELNKMKNLGDMIEIINSKVDL